MKTRPHLYIVNDFSSIKPSLSHLIKITWIAQNPNKAAKKKRRAEKKFLDATEANNEANATQKIRSNLDNDGKKMFIRMWHRTRQKPLCHYVIHLKNENTLKIKEIITCRLCLNVIQ